MCQFQLILCLKARVKLIQFSCIKKHIYAARLSEYTYTESRELLR